MRFSQMPQHALQFGTFRREDGETFTIQALLYETPITFDYWRAQFVASHAAWGEMHFTAILPKKHARSITEASAVVGGSILEQVKSELVKADDTGRLLTYIPSMNGWFLIG